MGLVHYDYVFEMANQHTTYTLHGFWFAVCCHCEVSSLGFWPSPSWFLRSEWTREDEAQYTHTLNETFNELKTLCERVKVGRGKLVQL